MGRTARSISKDRIRKGCSHKPLDSRSFLRDDSERQRTNPFRSIPRSIKTEKLLKLWREFYLRASGWERQLLVRGITSRLSSRPCRTKLYLSCLSNPSHFKTRTRRPGH